MKSSLLVLFICFWQAHFQEAYGQLPDSVWANETGYYKKFKTDGFVATSFFINKNWKSSDNSVISLAGNLNLSFRKSSDGLNRIHELRSELIYQKIIDSIWIKNSDNLFLSNNWIINGRTSVRNSFSLLLKTQITDTWEKSQSGNQKRVWKSGPLLPATLAAGYGMSWIFWKNSFLNFSFATLKIISFPRRENRNDKIKSFIKTEKAIISSEYGFNLQSSIEKMITKNIKWENKTTFFTKGLDKEIMNLDMQNTLSFYPARFIKIHFDIKTAYDCLISKKIQYRYEMMIGFYVSR